MVKRKLILKQSQVHHDKEALCHDEEALRRGEDIHHGKGVVHRGEEESYFKTSLEFTMSKTFTMAKLLFVAVKKKLIKRPFRGSPRRRLLLAMVKGKRLKCLFQVRLSKERIYVCILVLSQSRLLSHNSQACKSSPTHNIQYILRNKY